MNRLAIVSLFALAIGVAGCGKKPEAPKPVPAPPPVSTPAPAPPAAPAAVTLSAITIGNAIGADKKVTASLTTLGKNDTIYASVDTTGSGAASLTAKWTYVQGSQVMKVNEETLTIDAVGPATSEFHIGNPDGWPAGDYKVEVFINDVSAGTQQFAVK